MPAEIWPQLWSHRDILLSSHSALRPGRTCVQNTLFEMEQAASVMPPGGVMLIDDIRSHDGFLAFAKRHPEFKTILVSTLDGVGAIGIAVSD